MKPNKTSGLQPLRPMHLQNAERIDEEQITHVSLPGRQHVASRQMRTSFKSLFE